MLNRADIFIVTSTTSDGVFVSATHRTTKKRAEAHCYGSVCKPEEDGLNCSAEHCNPRECIDDLKAMVLSELEEMSNDR